MNVNRFRNIVAIAISLSALWCQETPAQRPIGEDQLPPGYGQIEAGPDISEMSLPGQSPPRTTVDISESAPPPGKEDTALTQKAPAENFMPRLRQLANAADERPWWNHRLRRHVGEVTRVEFVDDSTMVTSATDKMVSVWKKRNGTWGFSHHLRWPISRGAERTRTGIGGARQDGADRIRR